MRRHRPCGETGPEIKKIETLINIDHHVTNTRFGNLEIVDTAACATAEIIYGLIKEMGVDISPGMAAAIYTGIFTDTGSFRFSNTNRTAFAICEEMVAIGMDPYKVAQNVYGTYSLGRIKLLNLALDSIELVGGGKISIMTLTRDMLAETQTQPEDADGLINYARRIEDVKLAALLQELKSENGQGGGRLAFMSVYGQTEPWMSLKSRPVSEVVVTRWPPDSMLRCPWKT